MKFEVLVSTMNQTDYSLLEKMNIQTDAIIVNQCNRNSFEEFDYKGHRIKWLSLEERGVGLSRNTALMRSTADVVLFADDDVVYSDNYFLLIEQNFKKHPNTDLIVYNLESLNPQRPIVYTKKDYKLCLFNCLKFGACQIAVKTAAIRQNNIFFSLLFGGGAIYSAGEDSLFMYHALRSKIHMMASATFIGTVAQTESTWFDGYTEKYFYDKGAFFSALSKKSGWLLCRLMLLKNKKKLFKCGVSYNQGKKLAKAGLIGFKHNLSYAQWKESAKGLKNS